MFEERNYIEFRDNVCSRLQRAIFRISLIVAILIFCIEVIIYTTLLTNQERVDLSFQYVLLRIICPTFINFSSLIVANIFRTKKNVKTDTKNFFVSFSIYVICGVLAIFHNFFQILLVSVSIPFLICSAFGDTKLLNKLALMTAVTFIISGITYWTDPGNDGSLVYKTLTLICNGLFYICSFLFSRMIVNNQKEQLTYINRSYVKQTELVEELKIEPLTKLYNRSALNTTIDVVIRQSLAKNAVPIIVMMDLDHFKCINDKYGHICGDDVLVRLANIIKEDMGSTRNAFRFGGEEFVLIFKDSSLEDVIEMVEKIRRDLAKERFEFAPEKCITISAGICVYESEWDSKEWLENADKALYVAKESGRDCIQIFQL